MKILGLILAVLGAIAIAIAPSIMNQAEIGTLRTIGGIMAGVGVVLVLFAVSKKTA